MGISKDEYGQVIIVQWVFCFASIGNKTPPGEEKGNWNFESSANMKMKEIWKLEHLKFGN